METATLLGFAAFFTQVATLVYTVWRDHRDSHKNS